MAAQAFANGFSVVTLGDFNDFDPTVRDAADSIPISQVLDIVRDPVPEKSGDGMCGGYGLCGFIMCALCALKYYSAQYVRFAHAMCSTGSKLLNAFICECARSAHYL